MSNQEIDNKIKEIATNISNTTIKHVRKAYIKGTALGMIIGLLISLIIKYI